MRVTRKTFSSDNRTIDISIIKRPIDTLFYKRYSNFIMLLFKTTYLLGFSIIGSVAIPAGLLLPISPNDCRLSARSANSSRICPQSLGNHTDTNPSLSGLSTQFEAPVSSYREYLDAAYENFREQLELAKYGFEAIALHVFYENDVLMFDDIQLLTNRNGDHYKIYYSFLSKKWSYLPEIGYNQPQITEEQARNVLAPEIAYEKAEEWVTRKGLKVGDSLTLQNNTKICPAAKDQLTWRVHILGRTRDRTLFIGAIDGKPYTCRDN